MLLLFALFVWQQLANHKSETMATGKHIFDIMLKLGCFVKKSEKKLHSRQVYILKCLDHNVAMISMENDLGI
jgi:hypothetical protein